MKKTLIIPLLAIFTLALCALTASAETFTGDCGYNGGDNVKYEYDTETGVMRLYGTGMTADYWSSGIYIKNQCVRTVIIEEGITSIGNHLFSGDTMISEVIFPSTLLKIGDCAFRYNGIKSIDLSRAAGLIEIGDEAFSSCRALETVILPNSVTTIGKKAFANCPIKSVTLPSDMKRLGESAFQWCHNLENVVFPSGLTEIGDRAFSGCVQLNTVNLPPSVRKIGDGAFSGCESLSSVNWPQDLSSIGAKAFTGCSRLEIVELPLSAVDIGEEAFANCRNLSEVRLMSQPASRPGYGVVSDAAFKESTLSSFRLPPGTVSIGANTFEGCYIIGAVLPDSLKSIGDSAFKRCRELKSAYIPSQTSFIGHGVFDDCINLREITVNPQNPFYTSVGGALLTGAHTRLYKYPPAAIADNFTVPSTVTVIDEGAFSHLINLKRLTLPDGVTEIKPNTFSWSQNLESVILPKNLKSIGSFAFSSCTNLKSIALPDGLEAIGQCAFSGCDSITALSLPAGLRDIYETESAFYLMSALSYISVSPDNPYFSSRDGVLYSKDGTTLIKYPENAPAQELALSGIEKIGMYAMTELQNLKKLVLPEGLVEIGERAFCYSPSLEYVQLPSTLKSTGIYTFMDCSSLKDIILPSEMTDIGQAAFLGCKSLTDITLPPALKSIGNTAFWGCGLRSVKIPVGVEIVGNDAFAYNPELRSVLYPETVTEIGYDQIYGCTLVRTLALPTSIRTCAPSNNSEGLSLLYVPGNSYGYSSYMTTIICRQGSQTEEAARIHGLNCIPAIIGHDDTSKAMSKILSDKAITINGAEIPVYNVAGTDFAAESDLRRCGYSFSWDPDARTTTVTAPDSLVLSPAVSKATTAEKEIISSDIMFYIGGYVVPSLNIGDGDSILSLDILKAYSEVE